MKILICLYQIFRAFRQLGINHQKIIDACNRILELRESAMVRRIISMVELELIRIENDDIRMIEPKRREGLRKEVKYPVGCIFTHKLYHYNCVVVGWDEVCTTF